jgi:uncharacterized protein (UPF0248 family)
VKQSIFYIELRQSRVVDAIAEMTESETRKIKQDDLARNNGITYLVRSKDINVQRLVNIRPRSRGLLSA